MSRPPRSPCVAFCVLVVQLSWYVCAQSNDSTVGRTNRLSRELSPYLRDHADNAVHWYPWCEEALTRAKRENKVIFLSIGYSSCHWCHVMERESFHDPQIAALLNDGFICILVDREERPDIDYVYMTALQTFYRLTGQNGGGGWPLTMFLTPEAEPFFGGTYFPPRDGQRGFRSGLETVIRRVRQAWQDQEAQIRQDARVITNATRRQLDQQALFMNVLSPADRQAWRALWDSVESSLYEQFDKEYGGFGFDADFPDSPKFPEPPNLFYLLDRIEWLRYSGKDSRRAELMLEKTLIHMCHGGIYDQLGGGFHRYCVDRRWCVPHFEKMLYDNAQLLDVYSRAYALTQNPVYRQVAEEVARFLLRELRDPDGGFYAAIDADSEDTEGRYYVWSVEQIEQLLGPGRAKIFYVAYQLDQPPELEEKWHVLQLGRPLREIATALQVPEAELRAHLSSAREILLGARALRVRPHIDTKMIASWNGMMVSALVSAQRWLKRSEYLQAAVETAEFVHTRMRDSDGRLMHCYVNGRAAIPAFVDDYAFVVDAFLQLHEVTSDKKWLNRAVQLQRMQDELFWDDDTNSYYYTSENHDGIIGRVKIWVDNISASGNNKSAYNLVRLAQVTGDEAYNTRADRLLRSGCVWLYQAPSAVPELARAVAIRYLWSRD